LSSGLVDSDLHLPDEFALPASLLDEVAGHLLVQLAYLLDGELLELSPVGRSVLNAVVAGLRHHVPDPGLGEDANLVAVRPELELLAFLLVEHRRGPEHPAVVGHGVLWQS